MVTKKTERQPSAHLLARLVESYGVQTRYRDALGQVRGPSEESLTKILFALGAGVNSLSSGPGSFDQDLKEAIRRRDAEMWGRVLEPIVVAWEGVMPVLTVRLPAGSLPAAARLTLTLEDGSSFSGDLTVDRASAEPVFVGGTAYVAVRLTAARVRRALGWGREPLPWGRHRLRVEVRGVGGEASVIAAPRRCWAKDGWEHGAGGGGAAAERGTEAVERGAAAAERGAGALQAGTVDAALAALANTRWGLFAPVYALRSRRDWGAGDLADLAALGRWTGEVGGSLVATLPLLASSFGPDADPSPYRPTSRLFWNEFFLAPEETPEWALCARARSLGEAPDVRRRRGALRAGDHVDYQAVMAIKRLVLAELARCFFEDRGGRQEDFERYLHANPHAPDYAAHCAAAGAAGPAPPAAGRPWSEEERYHLYCQWQMDRQLALAAASGGTGLLFDLPLGVHPQGFDTRRWPGLFATGVSSGAPPDVFFAAGQDWSTPPLHPVADREQGYPYFAACLANLMRHAAVIRIDHVMSLHRLFWIPEGTDPKDGTYVSYPAEELYALLSCESHRYRTEVVGEDLGTVPPGVRASMRRHGVARTSIFLGALRPQASALDVDIPEGAYVTLETHDMVPLAGFLHGDDIATRAETGQVDRGAARREAAARRNLVARLARQFGAPGPDPDAAAPAILVGCLSTLARSAAETVLVNLEDLLLERRPQNVPGTGTERRNWRRKIAVALEELPRWQAADSEAFYNSSNR